MKGIYYLIAILLLISCTSHSGKLEQALDSAGDNRAEMERVLSYFKKKGKIPYKSACFIIENMPYHKSRIQITVDSLYYSFFQKTDSIYNEIFGGMKPPEALLAEPKGYDSLRKELAQIFEKLAPPQIIYTDEYDITTVSSD